MTDIVRTGVTKRWCSAAAYNGIVFVGGVTPKETRGASITEQTSEVLSILDARLAEVGSAKERILGLQIFLSDLSKAPEMNAVWDDWAPPGAAAARACVQAGLPEGVGIEITASAVSVTNPGLS